MLRPRWLGVLGSQVSVVKPMVACIPYLPWLPTTKATSKPSAFGSAKSRLAAAPPKPGGWYWQHNCRHIVERHLCCAPKLVQVLLTCLQDNLNCCSTTIGSRNNHTQRCIRHRGRSSRDTERLSWLDVRSSSAWLVSQHSSSSSSVSQLWASLLRVLRPQFSLPFSVPFLAAFAPQTQSRADQSPPLTWCCVTKYLQETAARQRTSAPS